LHGPKKGRERIEKGLYKERNEEKIEKRGKGGGKKVIPIGGWVGGSTGC
jgi:hypothetical protein